MAACAFVCLMDSICADTHRENGYKSKMISNENRLGENAPLRDTSDISGICMSKKKMYNKAAVEGHYYIWDFNITGP